MCLVSFVLFLPIRTFYFGVVYRSTIVLPEINSGISGFWYRHHFYRNRSWLLRFWVGKQPELESYAGPIIAPWLTRQIQPFRSRKLYHGLYLAALTIIRPTRISSRLIIWLYKTWLAIFWRQQRLYHTISLFIHRRFCLVRSCSPTVFLASRTIN